VPTAPYGREKAYAERLLDRFELERPDVRVVRLRPAFIFQRSSATQQRRLFGGPFAPASLARAVPIVPVPTSIRFQALHADDVADAYRRALVSDARGAFNVAAEPVIDRAAIERLLGARTVQVPWRVVRAGVAAAWRLHALPVHPAMVELLRRAPLLDTTRARDELGWRATRSAEDAIAELLDGLEDGAGDATPPLRPDRTRDRIEEIASGVGERV
jgi:UDP-glucose 4-epimerase